MRNCLKKISLVIFITSIVIVVFTFRKNIDVATLYSQLNALGPWAPLIFMGVYVLGVVFFLPGALLTITGGILFGAVWGTLYNIIAAVVGASLAFVIARFYAGNWVRHQLGGRLAHIMRGAEQEGWRFVAFMRVVPLFPFNLLNYAFGLTQIRLFDFMWASFIFMLPGTFAYTYLGSLGLAAIEGEERTVVTKGLIAVGLFVFLALLPKIIKLVRHSQNDL